MKAVICRKYGPPRELVVEDVPAPKAGAGLMGMPIQGARFAPPEASGAILFDVAQGKVTAAEERFRVRGQIRLNLLGQNTVVDIEEEQQFSLRIMTDNK